LIIIPKKSENKGLPRANILSINGCPLIAYSVPPVTEFPLINKVICSTDVKENAATAIKLGAKVPFFRPEEISSDLNIDLEGFYTMF